VTFQVDAYPTEAFEGAVVQIRLQPVVIQNVTTYVTVIDVPNPQLKLKPGMTANVRVEIVKRSNVLRVPTAALRFRPTGDIFTALGQEIPPEVQFAGRGGFRTGGAGGGGRGAASARVPAGMPAPPSAQSGDELGRSGQGGAGASGESDDRRGRMLERFKTMSPEEQKLFIARMKERGADTGAFEQGLANQKPSTPPTAKSGSQPKGGNNASPQTIDALFAPLQPVETRGRVWLFVNRQLKPVSLRLGITDGTNAELLNDDLQEGSEAVTGFTGLSTPRSTTGQTGTGNPLMPQRGFPGGRGGR
jgi:HlyD family secretion protein